jgi:hypothetical protein
MREVGLPPVLKWRWAPCAALVLGSLSFVGFALLAIPDHIGEIDASSTASSLQLGNQFARTQTPAPAAGNDWSGDTTNTVSASPSLRERAATRTGDVSAFPKRGFSPPLERAEPPAPPPAPPPPITPVQPQLNIPPPVPALPAPPPPAPAQAEPPAQATPVPPPPDAPAQQPPAAVQ